MDGAGPSILWAEDSRQDQLLIRAALASISPTPAVEFADDGVLLLDRLQSGGRPDLVVLDLKMPRIGGLEALRQMRAHPAWSTIPVAIFSAGDSQSETAACLQLGARQVVRKPVNFEEFTTAVHSLLH